METLRRNIRQLDFGVLGLLLLLGGYAFMAIAASTRHNPNPNIPSHILAHQIVWEVLGVIVMLSTIAFDYRWLRKARWWIYVVSIVSLIIVFFLPAQLGAHSWIDLKVLSVQPSEVAKLSLIIWLAGFMADRDEAERPDYRIRMVWPIAPIFVLPFALTFKEPALGQALVLFAITLTMYTVFAKRTHFALILVGTVAVVSVFSLAASMFSKQSTDFINNVIVKDHLLKSYQVNRITVWLNPKYSPDHYGYNIHVAQIAVGSGKLFGEGLFNGTLTNNGWVPNQWTDYIFTAVGEELGYVGSATLIFLFLLLIFRLNKIAQTASDAFGTYMTLGIIGMLSFQIFENIGMDMYLSPSTGITLPFISYGGTSLVVDYFAIGLVLGIGVRQRNQRLDYEAMSLPPPPFST